MKDKLSRRIAWLLPRRLVYWCAVRLGAHATTGEHSTQVVPDLRLLDALDRWEGHPPGVVARQLAIMREVQVERHFQDQRWGGAAHDDTHTLGEWGSFMHSRVDALSRMGAREARRELIEIAALAVAAIESIDRKLGTR